MNGIGPISSYDSWKLQSPDNFDEVEDIPYDQHWDDEYDDDYDDDLDDDYEVEDWDDFDCIYGDFGDFYDDDFDDDEDGTN